MLTSLIPSNWDGKFIFTVITIVTFCQLASFYQQNCKKKPWLLFQMRYEVSAILYPVTLDMTFNNFGGGMNIKLMYLRPK